MTVAYMLYGYRQTYYLIILVAGYFKETQKSLWIEVGINIIVSVILAKKCGLLGVAIGTLTAMAYQTLYMAVYSSKYILMRPTTPFIKHILLDMLIMFLIIVACSQFKMHSISYVAWVILAFKVFVVSCIITILINGCCFRKEFFRLLSIIRLRKMLR
jgi:O-antigen/teichoic acid export membrane protein